MGQHLTEHQQTQRDALWEMALKVYCPFPGCWRPPHLQCLTRNGNKTKRPHRVRVQRAKERA